MKKMKQFAFRVLATAIAVAIFAIFLFCSCESSIEDIASTEQVQIFMSGVSTSDAPMKAPSATDENQGERKAIANGDTVDVYNVKDINIIMIAENEYGLPVNGQWGIMNIKNDLQYDPMIPVVNRSGGGTSGSSMSIKLAQLGLYAVYFWPKGISEQVMFYIRHTGTPGSLGDDWENDRAFRLDKVKYQVVNDMYTGYTLYVKYQNLRIDYSPFPYDESSEMNPALEQNWKALVFCDNHTFTTKDGFKTSAKEFQLRKCLYSKDYVCFSFLEADCHSYNGEYSVKFYSGHYGYNYWGFPAVDISNWEKNGYIVFKVI